MIVLFACREGKPVKRPAGMFWLGAITALCWAAGGEGKYACFSFRPFCFIHILRPECRFDIGKRRDSWLRNCHGAHVIVIVMVISCVICVARDKRKSGLEYNSMN